MDANSEYLIDVHSLPITPKNILKEMGYGKVQPQNGIDTLVTSMLEEVKSSVTPSCTFRLCRGILVNEKICLEGGVTFTVGKILASLLVGSELFALFTATAGNDFCNYQQSVKDDILRCFIADVIGTCLVEAVGDKMERLLEKKIIPFHHTNRFSPGYCGWKLTEQKTLFTLLGGMPCGIHLCDVCLMTPEKSISGIIGVGHKVNEKAYGCRFCDLKTCYKRKK